MLKGRDKWGRFSGIRAYLSSRRCGGAGILFLGGALAWAGCAPRPPADSGRIAWENARPGSRDWELTQPAAAREIEGYAGASSVAPGDTLELHVSTGSRTFGIDVFRTGWYRGAGARRVYRASRVEGTMRAMPRPRAVDGMVACDWPVSHRVPVGPDWISGVYLARLTAEGGAQAFVPFVVVEASAAPDARAGARRAPILVQCAVTTWQAYNAWGGKSLYDFNSADGRATRVSFDRPYGSGGRAARGLGAGEFLTVTHRPHAAGWEYPMVRWLERNGYDVAYATDIDVHADPSVLEGRRTLLIVGHDEYWTRAMRNHVERARDRGVHLGIFGSNIGYWQIRLEPSPGGRSHRSIFCAKDPGLDPVYDTEADSELTVHFRHLKPRRPELSLVGMMLSAAGVDADFVPLPERRGHWVYEETGIARGGTRSIPGLEGYEVDRSFAGDSVFGAWSPGGLTVLARSPVVPPDAPPTVGEATLYTAPSGAMVFAAGTIQWSWGLDDWGAPELRPKRRHPDAEGITRNVLRAFLRDAGRGPG